MMPDKPSNLSQVTVSVRVYQLLLNAYPAKFRQEYSTEMMQVFQDCCLRAVRQGGINGLAMLWGSTLLDLIQSVISEHTQKVVEMKKEMKPEDIRMAGWALIAGAVAFVGGVYSLSRGIGGVAAGMYILSMTLLVVGLLVFRNRYGEKMGGFGENILFLGIVLGSLTSLLGLVGGPFHEYMLFFFFAGPMVLFTFLSVFGFVALYRKPLPRWNVLPVIAGLWYPIFFVSAFFIAESNGWTSWMQMTGVIDHALLLLQGFALAGLGYILKSDGCQEMAPA